MCIQVRFRHLSVVEFHSELAFLPWMFQHVQEGFWENADNVHTYIKWTEGVNQLIHFVI